MRIVESSAIALAGGYRQATLPAPLPVAPTPATAVVAGTPWRRPDPATQLAAGPDAGFVMQLIATAEPFSETDPFDRPSVYAPRAAATAAYRTTMAQTGEHRPGADVGLLRTI